MSANLLKPTKDLTAREDIALWFQSLQDTICTSLEKADGGALFKEDIWKHEEGGGGRTRVLQNGNVIEKGAVNISAVQGKLSENMMKALGVDQSEFYATGLSLIMHPKSPMVPIVHMNVRYFEMSNKKWWFGGGIDLTPHYINKEDAHFFHKSLKGVCDKFNPEYYSKFKEWADNYFFIKHRNETRGVGGIFFDRLSDQDGLSKQERFDFVKAIGSSFAPIYTHIVNKNKDLPYGEAQKQWQLLRRGRYVEFNLVYDQGTKFGLETNGRTESILLSLPPMTAWTYNFIPEKNSPEEQTLSLLKKGINWLDR